jgi:hypothetical protein
MCIHFSPPLPTEMNTLDKFMRQIMGELRSTTQNVTVNKTSTIGVDDIPAYKVEEVWAKFVNIFQDIIRNNIDNNKNNADKNLERPMPMP